MSEPKSSDSTTERETKVQAEPQNMSQISADHAELEALLGEIQDVLAKRLSTVARVTEMLSHFCDVLDSHFHGEESGGFFDDVVEKAPRLSNSVEDVKADHQALRDAIRRLVSATKQNGSDDWWERAERSFGQFSDSLMKHEQAERQLLLDAYWQDTGAQD